jgi:hypothetical protein
MKTGYYFSEVVSKGLLGPWFHTKNVLGEKKEKLEHPLLDQLPYKISIEL